MNLFHLINGLAGKNIYLDKFFIFITHFGNPLLFLWIVLFRKLKPIVKAVTAYIIVRIVDVGINLLYYRPRPFVNETVNLLIKHKATASFPSGHAMGGFCLATLIFLHNKKQGIIAYIIAFLVAFSRIFVGVHYPLDTVVGLVLGVLIALGTHYVFEKYKLMDKIKKIWKKKQ